MRHLSNDTRPTRRDLLKTLTLILAPALPATRLEAQAPSHVMNALSTYMSGAATRELPAEVVEHARQHIADTFAAMISGSELPPGHAAIRYAKAHGGTGVATIAGSMMTAGPADAAMAKGVMAHADETDDSHSFSQSHPGCAVVPAALAAGEAFGVAGTRFPRAVTLG